MPVRRHDSEGELIADDKRGNQLIVRKDTLTTLVMIVYAAGGVSYTIRLTNTDMTKLAEQYIGKPF